MSKRATNVLVFVLVSSTLLLIALIFSDILPWLRGPAPETPEWYWPYLLRPLTHWWPSILAGIIMWGFAAYWLQISVPTRKQNILVLGGLMVGSLLLQLTLIYADRPQLSAELIDRTLSNQASGFFEPAAEIDNIQTVLRSYPQIMPTLASEHAQTHPPGLIIANWLTVQAFRAVPTIANPIAQLVRPLRCTDLWLLNRPANVAAALGIWAVIPLFSAAFTVLPAYGLGRRLLPSTSARLATVLIAIMPALLLFAPKSVQLYAPLTLLLFWLFHIGLEKQSLFWLFSAGLLLSAMSFLSLGNAALLLLLFCYALFIRWQEGSLPNSSNIKQAIIFSLGAALIWLLYWLGWGVPPWEIAQSGLGQHYALVTNLRRYDWWVIWNLVDVVMFGGWPLVLGFIGGLFLATRKLLRKELTAVDALALALLLLITILNFSGSARGEVGRIWLFFMPLMAYPSARFWHKTVPGRRFMMLLVALQLAVTVSLGLAWQPVRAVIVNAERPLLPTTSPQNSLNIPFASEPITLTGYSLDTTQAQPGGQINLTLFWQAQGAAQRPYTVFTQLLDENGNLVAQQDNWPVQGQWPPTCWRAGDTIPDIYTIQLPDEFSPGSYTIVTGLYDALTGERLPMEDGRNAIPLQELNN